MPEELGYSEDQIYKLYKHGTYCFDYIATKWLVNVKFFTSIKM